MGELIPIGVHKTGVNKKNCCNKFGRVTRKDKGVYNCVLNTGENLEPGDLVSLWADLDTYWETAIYNGGDLLDNDNFEPIITHNMGTTCSLPVDAIVSEWSDWSNCVADEQTRTRTIITPASNGGITPDLIETQACNNIPFPVRVNHQKNIQGIAVIQDKISSTVKVYFDGVLVRTDILDMINYPPNLANANGIHINTYQGVSVMIEHIVEPTTNDVAVKSVIKRLTDDSYNSPIISSETVIGTLGNVVINSLTFIMPNAIAELDCFARYVQD